MGPNGSGKSTLLKLLAFIEKPSSGEILYDGKPAAPFSPSVRFRVTLLTQDPYLMKRTVFENVSYGLKLRGEKDRAKLAEKVEEALSLVGLAPEFSERYFRELSGGEAQRVALAARLALKPEVLLLDEPTASVDALSGQYIREASLNARSRWKTTLVVASHDLQWLRGVCDKTYHLYNGKIFGSGLETLLFGPWVPESESVWKKELGNGRKIFATPPPSPEASAVLISEKIFLSNLRQGTDHDNCLEAVVSRMEFQKSQDGIVATVVAGNVPFTATVSREKISRLGLYPGKKVFVAFNSADLKWISV
jgi:tungstate transport system ATP-binding protein